MPIHFYFDEIKKPTQFKSMSLKKWLNLLANYYQIKIENLQYVFVNDERLLAINQQFLQHDTYTDIITFSLNEHVQNINGEIYISIDRIKENAQQFEVEFFNELLRVMAHGFLHLIGYKDKKKSDKILMKEQEDKCIELFFSTK